MFRLFQMLSVVRVVMLLSVYAGTAFAQSQGEPVSDSSVVVETVHRYHDALSRGDSAVALALLTPDAIVLESGGMETRAEYRAQHLPADMAFAAGVPSQRTVRRVEVTGGMAWVASTSTSQGEFRGRPINSAGAELIILNRTAEGWKISAIHWSSRTRR
jgi:ketosteroid isomerase-like protein